MCKNHTDDPVHNCWYAPSNHGDSFGIRHDEIYFHSDIIPSQPVTSYSVLIRGSHGLTSVYDGIGERLNDIAWSKKMGCDVMVNRSASLINGLMKARNYYMSSEFTQDKIKTTSLSMQWYNYIFSCSMQFFPGSIERYKAPEMHSKHIIVMVRGNMYKLDMMKTDEKGQTRTINERQLKRQLKSIIEMDASRQPSIQVGVLTSLPPSDRYLEEQRIKCISQQNVVNLSLLRDAIFVLALDAESCPRTANEAMFSLQSGNFVNRWYDKSVQLVVFGNGVAGFVNNYLAGMTGTVGTKFVGKAVGYESISKSYDGTDDVIIWQEPRPLIWDDSSDDYFKKKSAALISNSRISGPFKQLSQDVFKICHCFSFEAMCKSSGVTPGAAFQAGLQLALAKIAGKMMSVNEVVSIRHFRFGGMTFMDASMADMKIFIEKARQRRHNVLNMSKLDRMVLNSLLLKATQSYKEEVLRYKKGYINVWHLDSLYRNLGLVNRLPFRNPPTLNPKNAFRQTIINFLRSPLINLLPPQIAENVTSNPSWFPEIEAIGRPGVQCILPPSSMALHYMFGRDAISITVNANPNHPCYGKEEEFARELELSLHFIKDLLHVSVNRSPGNASK
ncbi:Choline O-acetyltransferase [Exaiptasia diaphana]|nr:Choline O-acetyltransferase [Exaiptasia diaphana]